MTADTPAPRRLAKYARLHRGRVGGAAIASATDKKFDLALSLLVYAPLWSAQTGAAISLS